jgi:hypothetical protein
MMSGIDGRLRIVFYSSKNAVCATRGSHNLPDRLWTLCRAFKVICTHELKIGERHIETCCRSSEVSNLEQSPAFPYWYGSSGA